MSEKINKEYRRFREALSDNAEAMAELDCMAEDPSLLEDAFFRHMEFGTGGLRGIMGMGTNRMNEYTVRRATLGLGDYLLERADECTAPTVAIGYDTRNMSRQFAEVAAAALASLGIGVYMYAEPLPTPMLSYATRALGCSAGIMITASHNPSVYNGYKVYGSDGCQITDEAAEKIYSAIEKRDYFECRAGKGFDALVSGGFVRYIGDSVIDGYIREVKALSVSAGDEICRDLSVVYTPLNGTGYIPVTRILREMGYTGITLVEEQTAPDGNFPTCPYPNPELPDALTLGLDLAKRINAEILLATDPDCDRVGVAVKDGGDMRILTGNEVGVLLLDYVARAKMNKGDMPKNPVAVKTVVTSPLAARVAAEYGIKTVDVLTGFKYIGEVIGRLDAGGESDRFVIGFEESCGYLTGTHARDKDGVNAALLITEMAAAYKARGERLLSRLDEIYSAHGREVTDLFSYTLAGADGAARIDRIMESLRGGKSAISDLGIAVLKDYSLGLGGLPVSNVLSFTLRGGGTLTVRPSGTEPKIKLYVAVSGSTEDAARKRIDLIRQTFLYVLESTKQ